MIVGDQLIPRFVPNISLQPRSTESPLSVYARSLELLRPFNPVICLPGHVAAFTDIQAAIDDTHAMIVRRGQLVWDALTETFETGYEIARRRYFKPGAGWNVRHYLDRIKFTETLAYLEHLLSQGRVERREVDGVRQYRKVSAPAAG
jgi:hypothetical protein